MALFINTNVASLNAQRQMVRSGAAQDSAMERLSSGKRINSAADDAAGLAISNRMTSQIRGLDQAVRNANDGVSLIQTAEGALEESTNILQRMRELSIQAANGIYSDSDRATLNAEVQQLVSELDRIAETTSFNGQTLLDGNVQNINLQVGAEAAQVISFDIPAMSTDQLGLGGTSSDLAGSEMNITASSGTFGSEIAANSIKINGQFLESLATDDVLQVLLDDINSNVVDIEATAFLHAEADSVGTGVLQGGDEVTITAYLANGQEQTFLLTDTNSLQELVDDINGQAGSLLTAQINDSGKLTLTSESLAAITVIDTDSGQAATGMPQQIVTKTVTPTVDATIATIVDRLQADWFNQAEDRILDFYGIAAGGVNITLNLETVANGESDGVGGTLASVSSTSIDGNGIWQDITLNIDMEDFASDPLLALNLHQDRVLAHELTHAVMSQNMNLAAAPLWFVEGTAEFIHGGDKRVTDDITTHTSATLVAGLGASIGGDDVAGIYSAGYLAVKMIDAELREAQTSAGSTINGIKELMQELAAGSSMDAALGTLATNYTGHFPAATGPGWTDVSTFETHFKANGVDFIGGAYLNAYLNLGDAGAVDTGSIGGSDTGNGALTPINVFDELDDGAPINFNLIIPDQYLAIPQVSQVIDDAQFTALLQLRSTVGEAITISTGAAGTEDDLQTLGFVSLSSAGLANGSSLTSSAQTTALMENDLVINGVAIEATTSGGGLFEKVDHINEVTDRTGVVASLSADQSYTFDQGVQTIDLATTSGVVDIHDVPYQFVEAGSPIDFAALSAGSVVAGSGMSFDLRVVDGRVLTGIRLDSSSGYANEAQVVAHINAYLRSSPVIDAGIDVEAYLSSANALGIRDLGGGGSNQLEFGLNASWGAVGSAAGSYNKLLGFDIEGLANGSDDDTLKGAGPAFEIDGVTVDLSGAKNNDGAITVDEIATAVNAISDSTGVTAYVDNDDKLHLNSDVAFTLSDDNGSGILGMIDGGSKFNTSPALLAATVGSVIVNGSEVALSDLDDLDQVVSDFNSRQANTGVTASIDDNGELYFSANSAIRFDIGNTAGYASAESLGLGMVINGDGSVDAVTVNANLELRLINDRHSLSIEVSSNGEEATGLKSMNEADVLAATGTALESLSIATQAMAQDSVDSIDIALETINETRSQLGAVNNRLEFTISNLMNISENTAAARSRIVDADFAAETANLSRSQVLQQAAQAMLAQANSAPSQVLSLLR